ncbi:MAG: nicotinate-nucleotide--dimethylbenzimidazole phosphoribosyltransferase [Clostridiales bacterium 38-18]|nr:MAG: nicotinate-nucleotide--dimethylbenzimidazole phosphoribosyltransferase [Clostridiales bacterium 38-18]
MKAFTNELSQKIQPLCMEKMTATRQRVDQLVKPQGSLGALEEIAVQLSGIYQTEKPTIEKKAVIVMCADHGVCEEDIASAPPIVTWVQSLNIAKGVSGVGALAKHTSTSVYTVDIGINFHEKHPSLIDKRIANGSNNIAKTNAMTLEQALEAIQTGIDMVGVAKADGHNLIATGEMGIGNTTPSTAILSVLSGKSPEEITGIGANFPVQKLSHKAAVIRRAIESKSKDQLENPIELLAALGGYDIAGMTGIMLGGAIHRIPVVVDGYISSVSALIAKKINPEVTSYLFASHASEEKSASLATELLGLKPYLHMNMRLGEGSGAVLAFGLLEAACAMNRDMITFEEAGIAIV